MDIFNAHYLSTFAPSHAKYVQIGAHKMGTVLEEFVYVYLATMEKIAVRLYVQLGNTMTKPLTPA